MEKYLVITALGEDRPGIVNDLSKSVVDNQCNIIDSRMTVLGSEFAVILLACGSEEHISQLEQALNVLEETSGMTIITKRTKRLAPQTNLVPYSVKVVSLDHPGIVYQLASYLSEHKINIQDLHTDHYFAPHTGTPMFAVEMKINVPADTSIARLRDAFLEYCDNLNLDAIIEPAKA
jgi:glycine cleavage system transcriptional repressor